MSVEELLAMSEEEKLEYLKSQETEVKLCNALDEGCQSCQ